MEVGKVKEGMLLASVVSRGNNVVEAGPVVKWCRTFACLLGGPESRNQIPSGIVVAALRFFPPRPIGDGR